MNLPNVSAQISPSAFMACLRTAASESPLTLQIRVIAMAVPGAAEMDGLRDRLGGQIASRRPKRRFRNFSRARAPSSISIALWRGCGPVALNDE
jgi:hypothetical protein